MDGLSAQALAPGAESGAEPGRVRPKNTQTRRFGLETQRERGPGLLCPDPLVGDPVLRA